MVFIEQNSNYLRQIEGNEKLKLLSDYLFNKEVVKSEHLRGSDSNDVFKLAIYSLKFKEDFKPTYEIFSKRKPDYSSSWIYDNELLFILICIVKYQKLDTKWLEMAVNKIECSTPEGEMLKNTFLDILKDNLHSNDINVCVKYSYMKILGQKIEDNFDINSEFNKMISSPFPIHDSELLNILSLYFLSIMFEIKGLINLNKIKQLEKFDKKFINRVDFIVKIIFLCLKLILWLIFIFLFIWLTIQLFINLEIFNTWADKVDFPKIIRNIFEPSTTKKENIGNINTIGGILGISISSLGGLYFFNKIKNVVSVKLKKFLYWFWGREEAD